MWVYYFGFRDVVRRKSVLFEPDIDNDFDVSFKQPYAASNFVSAYKYLFSIGFLSRLFI